MPFLGFSILGSLLGTIIVVGATVYAVNAPPNPLMEPGGNKAVTKWAGPPVLKQSQAAN